MFVDRQICMVPCLIVRVFWLIAFDACVCVYICLIFQTTCLLFAVRLGVPIALFYSLQKQQKTQNITETISIKNFKFCIFQTIRPAVFILMCVWYFCLQFSQVKQSKFT